MLKAALVHRLVVVCPVCKSDRYRVHRRLPGSANARVLSHCACERCGAEFRFEEDRIGRALPR